MKLTFGRAGLVLIALAAGALIAACGSSTSSATTAASASSAAATSTTSTTDAGPGAGGRSAFSSANRAKLASCLKSHGVTLPSRPAGGFHPPSGSAGGSSTTPHRRFFLRGAANPKMAAALKACGVNFKFGSRGARAFRPSHAAVTKFVACVKQHGYTLPAPNFSGKGPIFPSNIESNPKFQAASKSCQNLLIPSRPPGGSSNAGA